MLFGLSALHAASSLAKGKTPSVLRSELKGLNDRRSVPLLLASVLPLGLLLLSGQPGLTHLLQSFTGVHDEGQSHGGGAVAVLPREAQEGGPEEGAAAHEGRPHVQRHQDKVQKL